MMNMETIEVRVTAPLIFSSGRMYSNSLQKYATFVKVIFRVITTWQPCEDSNAVLY
jgi:hypothetical protein